MPRLGRGRGDGKVPSRSVAAGGRDAGRQLVGLGPAAGAVGLARAGRAGVAGVLRVEDARADLVRVLGAQLVGAAADEAARLDAGPVLGRGAGARGAAVLAHDVAVARDDHAVAEVAIAERRDLALAGARAARSAPRDL